VTSARRVPVFIIGTGRCGSTPVQEILSRHPDVGFISNVDALLARMNLKGRWNNRLYSGLPHFINQRERVRRGSVRQTRLHYGPSEAWRLFNQQVSPLFSRPFRDLTADDATPWLESRMRRLFTERMEAQGKPIFLHHLTGWPRTGFLHHVFPDARFIHVFRDGRAVADSYLRWPLWGGWLGPEVWGFGPLPDAYAREWEQSGRSFVALAGLEWKIFMDAFVSARANIPHDLWIDIRYEDFVENPRQDLARLLDFLDLRWTDEFEKGFAGYSLSTSRKQGFRKTLTEAQVALLENIQGDHLRRLGYLSDS
jgi:Sulfotransferase family